jgi:hypothetical protein
MMSSFEYGPDEITMGSHSRSVQLRHSQASTGLPHGNSRIHGRNLLRLFSCVQYVFLQKFRDDTHTGLPEHGEMVARN